jgi:hypothetical protein
MQIRVLPLVAWGLLSLAGLGIPAEVMGQTEAQSLSQPAALQIGARSRERAARWAGTAPVVHCSPAPLTERPGAQADFSRPRVVPLEDAFLDARIAKRSIAARLRDASREQRVR